MRQPTLGERLRYRFDALMSKGPVAMMAMLALISALIVLGISAVVALLGVAPDDTGFGKLVWMSLMRTFDAGNMADDEGSLAFVAAMLLVTLAGIFIVSTLIGVLGSALNEKLDELRRGRSRVLETGHTVILGWSSQVFTVVHEIVAANENQKRSCIAILADLDKVEMEDALRTRLGSTGRTLLACRSGNPLDPTELELVNPHAARAIVVLPPEEGAPDAMVLKTVLALTNSPHRREGRYHIVSQVRDAKNLPVIQMVGRDDVTLVQSSDFVARTIVQTCRQAGLSVVWTELLDFGGDEIYFAELPELVGRTFGETLLRFEESSVIGLATADGVRLNPPMDQRLAAGDRLVVISADDDTIRLLPQPVPPQTDAVVATAPRQPEPEQILILGWNRNGATIVQELDHYVARGTALCVVVSAAAGLDGLRDLSTAPANLTLTVHHGDITDRQLLDSLQVPTYDHVILLSEESAGDVQQADARTLTTLLHLRDMEEQLGEHFNIVSEMLDPRNRELAHVTHADDFIVSDQLVSLMLSQLAENRDLAAVFEDLLDADGSELYVRPAEDYVQLGRELTFATVVAAAQARGEVALGYRLASQQRAADAAFGVRVNPPKSSPVTFAAGDRLVLLAED
ncbi:MAG: NAD-binding protein [Fimbriimonadaceae bacterium]|nr:NAD-binding protein [Fimbriimonadaceae bacterium]